MTIVEVERQLGEAASEHATAAPIAVPGAELEHLRRRLVETRRRIARLLTTGAKERRSIVGALRPLAPSRRLAAL